MLAGAWGTEWYFGYKHPHSDLSCEDYRSRDLFWDMASICIAFFEKYKFPVNEMNSKNEVISSRGDFCFAKAGDSYIILLKKGGASMLNLEGEKGEYTVDWFNPRTGGALQKGALKSVKGGSKEGLGLPPSDEEKDWVVVVRKK